MRAGSKARWRTFSPVVESITCPYEGYEIGSSPSALSSTAIPNRSFSAALRLPRAAAEARAPFDVGWDASELLCLPALVPIELARPGEAGREPRLAKDPPWILASLPGTWPSWFGSWR